MMLGMLVMSVLLFSGTVMVLGILAIPGLLKMTKSLGRRVHTKMIEHMVRHVERHSNYRYWKEDINKLTEEEESVVTKAEKEEYEAKAQQKDTAGAHENTHDGKAIDNKAPPPTAAGKTLSTKIPMEPPGAESTSTNIPTDNKWSKADTVFVFGLKQGCLQQLQRHNIDATNKWTNATNKWSNQADNGIVEIDGSEKAVDEKRAATKAGKAEEKRVATQAEKADESQKAFGGQKREVDSKISDTKSKGAHNVHRQSVEIIEHWVRRSRKLDKQGGRKAQNLRFYIMIYYIGMIIYNYIPFAERLGNQNTSTNLHIQSMEDYGDHGNAPGIHWQQERQNMMGSLMEIQKVGGPSLTHSLGKHISHSVIDDESRNFPFLLQGCRTDDDSKGSESPRIFASMICMLMKFVDEWKPD
jgi:hypothetical protein